MITEEAMTTTLTSDEYDIDKPAVSIRELSHILNRLLGINRIMLDEAVQIAVRPPAWTKDIPEYSTCGECSWVINHFLGNMVFAEELKEDWEAQ